MNEKLNNVNRVSISAGNTKMGSIPSVSLPPIVTCPAGCPCAKKCYAAKLCRLRPAVRNAYQRNLDILNCDWDDYWRQVRSAIMGNRFFRFHVSGDIPNAGYFKEMVISAQQNPHCQILAFTKRYQIVNNFIAVYGPLPENLHIIFSLWDPAWNVNVENPHDLPTSAVIFKGYYDGYADNFDKICPGNCFDCACRGTGCWTLEPGETIAFYEH